MLLNIDREAFIYPTQSMRESILRIISN